jgi:UDP-N-acetylmuramate: L-alanyl-gamma-D-glutamyl-meso-diaminopimelate ligase
VFHFPIFGAQNLENALGAASVALAAGLSPEELKAGLATFRGVRRRQEILGTPRGITIIDDFAHHPTAVRATLAAVRTRFPDQHLWALFEPRSNTSRRKIYQVDYSEAFDLADRVVIAAPQGGSPVPESERLDPQALANAIAQRGKDAHYSETIDALVERIAQEAKPGEVVLLMSNGSFGGLAQKLMGRLARP